MYRPQPGQSSVEIPFADFAGDSFTLRELLRNRSVRIPNILSPDQGTTSSSRVQLDSTRRYPFKAETVCECGDSIQRLVLEIAREKPPQLELPPVFPIDYLSSQETKNLVKLLQCPVCYEFAEEDFLLECGHHLCGACWDALPCVTHSGRHSHDTQHKRCPTCRGVSFALKSAVSRKEIATTLSSIGFLPRKD